MNQMIIKRTVRHFALQSFSHNQERKVCFMKIKRIVSVLCVMLLLIGLFGITAYAAGSGDVAGAVESTWKDASKQIKSVVNMVVFPAIDLILAVFFFAKLATAYFDCAPVTAM